MFLDGYDLVCYYTECVILISFKNMKWQIIYYNEALQQEIMSLSAGFQVRYIHLTQRMTTYVPHLGMPHSRALDDGLFELRLKSEEGIVRVFYWTLVGNNIVMLHTYVKKSKKTPLKELEVARRRMQEMKTNDNS